MLLFPFSFYHATHNFLIQKKCPYFHLFPYSFSLFFTSLVPCDKSEREEPPQRANRQGRECHLAPGGLALSSFYFSFYHHRKVSQGFVLSIALRISFFFSFWCFMLYFIHLHSLGQIIGLSFHYRAKMVSWKKDEKWKKKQFFEIIHEVRNIKFLLSSPVLLSFFFSFRYLSFLPSFSSRPHSGFPLFLLKGERTGNFPFFLNKVNLNYSFCGGKWPSVPDSIPLVYSKMDVLLSTIISYTLKYNIIKKTQQQLINIILTLVSILELCIHKESKSEHI